VTAVALSADSRPQLTRKARLRTDRLTGDTLLLYPEHGLVLNPSAAAILRLCDGRSVADIAAELTAPLGDILEFLATLSERGLITERAERAERERSIAAEDSGDPVARGTPRGVTT